jgi:hypothetical protein
VGEFEKYTPLTQVSTMMSSRLNGSPFNFIQFLYIKR